MKTFVKFINRRSIGSFLGIAALFASQARADEAGEIQELRAEIKLLEENISWT